MGKTKNVKEWRSGGVEEKLSEIERARGREKECVCVVVVVGVVGHDAF